jgi:transcriptional regulator with XRE-family HTH domain
MTNIRAVLAENIKAYRNALGLTQAKLAERVDTSTHYIGMIETQKNYPSPEMLERIAAALGVDTLDLFSAKKNLSGTLKSYRKTALKEVKTLVSVFLDEKLKELK